jgi:hypothetical protein
VGLLNSPAFPTGLSVFPTLGHRGGKPRKARVRGTASAHAVGLWSVFGRFPRVPCVCYASGPVAAFGTLVSPIPLGTANKKCEALEASVVREASPRPRQLHRCHRRLCRSVGRDIRQLIRPVATGLRLEYFGAVPVRPPAVTRGSKSTERQIIGTLSTLVVGSTRPIVSRPDLLGAHRGASSYKKAGAVRFKLLLVLAGLGPFQCRVRVRGDRNLRSVSAGPPGRAGRVTRR